MDLNKGVFVIDVPSGEEEQIRVDNILAVVRRLLDFPHDSAGTQE
jgi:hypothetical protein